ATPRDDGDGSCAGPWPALRSLWTATDYEVGQRLRLPVRPNQELSGTGRSNTFVLATPLAGIQWGCRSGHRFLENSYGPSRSSPSSRCILDLGRPGSRSA